MSDRDTKYAVRLQYLLEDRAERRARALDVQLQRVARSSSFVERGFRRLATFAAVGFGFREAGRHLIGFNNDMEQARTQMAGMIQLTTGGDWTDNLAKATGLVRQLQLRARESVGTTAEMVQMAGMISRPVLQAGLGMKDLEQFASMAVVAGHAFGDSMDVVARDIDQALRGQFYARDPFMSKLLGPMGFVGEEGRQRFNALTEFERAQTLQKAFAQPALAQLARAQAGTFAGVTSTLADNLQFALGQVGQPLFEAITAEVQKWNTWLDANQKTVSAWAADFGRGLVQGFNAVRSAVGWIIDHRELLLTIAKAWLAFKGVQMGQAAWRGAVDLWQRMSAFGQSLDAGVSSMGRFGMGMGSLIGTFAMFGGALGLATQALLDYAFAEEDKAREMKADLGALPSWSKKIMDDAQGMGTDEVWMKGMYGRLLSTAQARGFIKDGKLNQDLLRARSGMTAADMAQAENLTDFMSVAQRLAVRSALRGDMDLNEARRWMSGEFEMGQFNQNFQDYLRMQATVLMAIGERDRQIAEEQFRSAAELAAAGATLNLAATMMLQAVGLNALTGAIKGAAVAQKSQINIHSVKIEVQSDDPDRFMFGLAEGFEDLVKNPSGAFRRLREG